MAAIRTRFGQPWPRYGYAGLNIAGVRVTEETAEQVAAVFACMDVIAAAGSSSDWNVYSGVRGTSNKEALPEDGLQYILNTRFNPEMTAQAGKRAMLLWAAAGTGYAEIERDMAGRIVALWPIATNRVDPRRDLETGRLFYRVTQDGYGGFIDMQPEELFIIRGAGKSGFAGDDTISRAIHTVATAIAIDQFQAAYFGNGTQLGGMLETPGKLDDKQFQRTQEQFNSKHRGARNAFKFGLLEGGLKFTPIGGDNQKAQVAELKNASIEDICRWFHVPPHKIQHLLRSTNNNIEHQGLEFSRDTMRPWKVEIEQEADYKLVAYRSKKFVEIDLDWAEQGDYKSRAEAYQILRACGVFTVNDVLRKLGENTITAAAGGDTRTMNGASVKLEDVGKNMLPAPSAAPAADPTAKAWLTSVYARVQRRRENRAADLRRAGRADHDEQARADAAAYARDQVAELAEALGARLDAAQRGAVEVINGREPATAAAAALELQ